MGTMRLAALTLVAFASAAALADPPTPPATAAAPPATDKAAARYRLLVLDLKANDVDASIVTTLQGLVATGLSQYAALDVVSGDDLKQLVQLEADRSSMGCSEDASCLAEIADALGAQLVVFGNVGTLGDALVLNLNLFDSQKAVGLGRVIVQAEDVKRIPKKLRPKLHELIGRFYEEHGLVLPPLAPEKEEEQRAPVAQGPGALPWVVAGGGGVATLVGLALVGVGLVPLFQYGDAKGRVAAAEAGFAKDPSTLAAAQTAQQDLADARQTWNAAGSIAVDAGAAVAAIGVPVAVWGVVWALSSPDAASSTPPPNDDAPDDARGCAMRARALGALAPVALLAACPIPASDAPAFGLPCDGACPSGYFCSASKACLPGDAPPAPTIDAFTVDKAAVRDAGEEEVTFTWSTDNALTCGLDALPGQTIDVNGSATASFQDAGDVVVTLACQGATTDIVDASVTVHVRKVLREALTLGSQADVDAAAGVEEVDGDVTADGVSLNDVSAMKLAVVHGNLHVIGVTGLTGLDMPELAVVDGDLIVDSDADLTAVDLESLTSVGGDFFVEALALLQSLSVPALHDVGGGVAWSTYKYPSFPSADGAVAATLPLLAALDAHQLATIGGFFDLEDADKLTTLNLPALTTIGGSVVLFGNDVLTRVSFPVLTGTGTLLLDSNDNLKNGSELQLDFGALEQIHAVDDFQSQLYSRFYDDALASGFYRPGDLRIVGNAFTDPNVGVVPDDNSAVTSFDLHSLRTVDGTLHYVGTDVGSLDLDALTDVGGLEITANNLLTSVSLAGLTHVGAGGLLLPNDDDIHGLIQLVSVDGDVLLFPAVLEDELSAFTTVGGNLNITGLDQADLAKLTALEDVGQLVFDIDTFGGTSDVTDLSLPTLTTAPVVVVDGARITSLDLCGLASVTSLTLKNTRVTSVDGLAHLGSATTLVVQQNPQLPACMVDALAAQMSTAPALTNTGNSVDTTDCAVDAAAVCGG